MAKQYTRGHVTSTHTCIWYDSQTVTTKKGTQNPKQSEKQGTTCTAVKESNPVVGSSRQSTRGRVTRATPTVVRLHCNTTSRGLAYPRTLLRSCVRKKPLRVNSIYIYTVCAGGACAKDLADIPEAHTEYAYVWACGCMCPIVVYIVIALALVIINYNYRHL
jgi:hypothetical protein